MRRWATLSALAADELVRVHDFSRARTIMDVGGAHGVLLPRRCEPTRPREGILFDLPHVIATAADAIAAQPPLTFSPTPVRLSQTRPA
jgi:hypothetical protein